MPTYILLGHLTEQGMRNVKDSPKRANALKEAAKKYGATVKNVYWTLGAYDVLAVIDAPDVEHWLYHLRPNACRLTVAGGRVVWRASGHLGGRELA